MGEGLDRHGNYFLGLPAWGFPGWKDRYFVDKPSRLASYADVFNTVEGNTAFYRIPDARSVERWCRAVAGRDFEFCFKLPRDVTHERRPDMPALESFLSAIRPLSEHLGPLLVQFPATVSPDDLSRFMPVFAAISDEHRFVIEVRNAAFFTEPGLLEPVLHRFNAGRVMLDSRPLFEGDRSHPELLAALHEKPDVPVLDTVYHDLTLVRLILHPDIVSNRRYIDEWADRVAAYLEAGVRTYMMIHCPNNLHCPALASDFHRALRAKTGTLDGLPAWPVPQQQDLLSH